jgi:hypothetical protein
MLIVGSNWGKVENVEKGKIGKQEKTKYGH